MRGNAIMQSLFDLDTALETDEGIHFFEAVSIDLDHPDLLEDPCVEQHYYPVHSIH